MRLVTISLQSKRSWNSEKQSEITPTDMRRQRQTSQDSLELLLDTLCNVFGGIILITCLLALMNNRKTDDSKQPTQGNGRGQAAAACGQ
jgi:hypothetical protein